MRAYRVSWATDGWERLGQADQFHPLYVPVRSQGAGRMDNPAFYAALYLASDGIAACGEVFGNHHRLGDDALWHRTVPGVRRCLVTVEVPEDLTLIDLDDAAVLAERGIRPSDVVRRDRERTQQIALRAFLDRSTTTAAALSWWSYHHPSWVLMMLWSNLLDDPVWFPQVRVTHVEPITLDLPDLVVAADTLNLHLANSDA